MSSPPSRFRWALGVLRQRPTGAGIFFSERQFESADGRHRPRRNAGNFCGGVPLVFESAPTFLTERGSGKSVTSKNGPIAWASNADRMGIAWGSFWDGEVIVLLCRGKPGGIGKA